MSVRDATRAFASLRIAYSLALLAAPGRIARPWLGSAADSAGGTVAVRGLAARDLVISLGVLATAGSELPRRAWLAACAVSDAVDVGATLLAQEGALPPRARLGTIAFAGGSATTALTLAAAGRQESGMP